MRKLESLDERRQYMLDICQAVHDFCIENNIFYSLSCGTLIGAYRHKGFIPWDDDFDIMMTRENYDRFAESFQHPRYKLMTCHNSTNHFYAFSRIVDTRTYSLTRKKSIWGQRNKLPGICLDLYIVENVPEDQIQCERLISKVLRYSKVHKYIWKIMAGLRIIGLANEIGSFWPLTMLCRQQYSIQHYTNPSTKVVCYAGGKANTTVLEKSLFYDYQKCEFENHEFLAIKNHSLFLTLFYGDWMTPPPEEKRIPYHGNNYYID